MANGFYYNGSTSTIETTGSLNIQTFGATGSLFGTASGNLTSASFDGTTLSIFYGDLPKTTASIQLSTGSFTGSFSGSFTGSLVGSALTASYVSASALASRLVAGTNITITQGADSLTINAAGGGGSTDVSTYLSSSWTGSNASLFSGTSSFAQTASYVVTALTASYVRITGSGIIVNTGSFGIQLTASAAGGAQTLQDTTTLGNSTTSSVEIKIPEFSNMLVASASLVHGAAIQTPLGSLVHAQGYGLRIDTTFPAPTIPITSATNINLNNNFGTTFVSATTNAIVYSGNETGTFSAGPVTALDLTDGVDFISLQFPIPSGYLYPQPQIASVNFDGVNTTVTFVSPLQTSYTGYTLEGGGLIASGYGSHAEGFSTTTLGSGSHAEGQYTTTIGQQSHAEGFTTISIGQWSHAEGYTTTSVGESAHAEGLNTKAIGNYSHAEGTNTRAVGNNSHAEGDQTTSVGVSSHAEGYATTAISDGSHAGGYQTTSDSNYQIVYGTLNNPNTVTHFDVGYRPFIVGVGGYDPNTTTLYNLNGLEVVSITDFTTGTNPLTPSDLKATIVLPRVAAVMNYANDGAAAAANVPVGGVYRNGNVLQIRIV